jgi:hypothetical protein
MLHTANTLRVFPLRNHLCMGVKETLCWCWSLTYCSLKSRECVEAYLRAFFSPVLTMSDCVCHFCDIFSTWGCCLKWTSRLYTRCIVWTSRLYTRCIVCQDHRSFLLQKEWRVLLQYIFSIDPDCSNRTCVDASSTQVTHSATLIP